MTPSIFLMPHRAVGFFGIVAILIAVFGTSVSHAQAEHDSASLFDVQLDAKASALWKEVEQLYGKPIKGELLPVDYPMPGKSKVGDDGTPIIFINPSLGRTSDVIVHELYHLILQSQGYPVIEWLPLGISSAHEPHLQFKQLSIRLYDPILHHVFYSDARARLGIDPGQTLEQLNRQAFSEVSATANLAKMDAEAIALSYFKIRLEVENQNLLQQFASLIEDQGKSDLVAVGERLAAIVLSAYPLSPASAVEALVECLNLFYKDRYTFNQGPWRQQRLGAHTQHIAGVEVRVAQRSAGRK